MPLPPLKINNNQTATMFDESPVNVASGGISLRGITNASKDKLFSGKNILLCIFIAGGAVMAYKKIKRV